MNRIFPISILLDDVFNKSTIQDMRKYFFSATKSEYNWFLFSDYYFGEEKSNKVIAFTIMPSCPYILELQKAIKSVAPKDIKHTRKISSDFMSLIDSLPLINVVFVFENKKYFIWENATEAKDAIRGYIADIHYQIDYWRNAEPLTSSRLDKITKNLNILEQLIKRGKKIQIISAMFMISILGGYVGSLICNETSLSSLIWFSDRDSTNEIGNNLIRDLFQISLIDITKKNINFNFTSANSNSDEWYEDLIRIPDYLAGAASGFDFKTNLASNTKTAQMMGLHYKNGNYILDAPNYQCYTICMTKQPQTLIEAIIYFSDETKAHDYVVSKRWKNGAECGVCGSTNLTFIETRKKWKCRDKVCTAYNKQFTVKKGTIFEDSPIKLSKWLPAIWMIANNKNGKSSCELGKDLGVTQKTAWFMLHRIRTSMGKGFVKLQGTVEVDETYMGGKASNMHQSKKAEKVQGRGVAGKTIVMGMVERSEEVSQVQAKVIPDTTKFTLQSEVIESVLKDSNLYTDGHLSYEGLDVLFEHLSVDHHLHEYVNGDVHTNTMENFWTLLKRAIKGTYVSVEDEHLDRYIDEQSFRYNTRKDSDYERFEKAVSGVEGKKITYAELTAHEQLRGA